MYKMIKIKSPIPYAFYEFDKKTYLPYDFFLLCVTGNKDIFKAGPNIAWAEGQMRI